MIMIKKNCMNTSKLVLVRHGQSQWNQQNRFTGWFDVDLSTNGHIEAKNAGQLLHEKGFIFNYGYTSVLKRAIHTLWIILDQLNQSWLPIKKAWQLNERHYGDLQGLYKHDLIKKYGYKKIHNWRRSFTAIPPRSAENNIFSGTNDIRYAQIDNLPNGESLEITSNRVIPYCKNCIIPNIKNNNCIIVVAHGNSIRSIIKYLNHLDEFEITQVEIPTGTPLVYEFNLNKNPINHYYLSSSVK